LEFEEKNQENHKYLNQGSEIQTEQALPQYKSMALPLYHPAW
jgi:hypothetical protein